MYKNIFWFMVGYVAHKHARPIIMDVLRKTTSKIQEGKMTA
jgi:hypothetical protein